MVGTERRKILDFDDPRSLEKALSEKESHQKLFFKIVEEILYWRIFLGAHTA